MPSGRIQQKINRLFEQIDAAIDQGTWARGLAENVLVLDPDNADAPGFVAAAERGLSSSSGRSTEETTGTASDPVSTPAAVDQPMSFSGGRYEVEKFLGEGGKKNVYSAKEPVLDREVAFALIKRDWTRPVGRASTV